MDKLNQLITLPDRRRLGFAEYGLADGYPVFALHGTPGSRLWFKANDETSLNLGIRLITVDRPGYGLSDPKTDRSLLQFTEDLAALANHLRLESYSVLGVSGGAAYAAACAYAFPDKINSVALVAGISEFENGKAPKAMCKPNRISFWLAKRLPWVLKLSFRQQKKLIDTQPEVYKKSIRTNVAHLCPADQAVVSKEENAEIILHHMREAFRNQATEAVNESRLLAKPWGFRASDINCPVHVWHGTNDTLAPIGEAKKLAAQIPGAVEHYIETKGHFLDDDPQVWEDILRSVKLSR